MRSLGAEICILHYCQFVCCDFMYTVAFRALRPPHQRQILFAQRTPFAHHGGKWLAVNMAIVRREKSVAAERGECLAPRYSCQLLSGTLSQIGD